MVRRHHDAPHCSWANGSRSARQIPVIPFRRGHGMTNARNCTSSVQPPIRPSGLLKLGLRRLTASSAKLTMSDSTPVRHKSHVCVSLVVGPRRPRAANRPLSSASGDDCGVVITNKCQCDRRATLRVAMGAVTLLGTMTVVAISSPTVARASNAIPICSSSQLTMSTNGGDGEYSAAGNEGVAFIFRNIGKRSCSLKGYPRFHFEPSSYRGKTTKITHNGGSEIFATVPPRLVVVKPGATASFGLGYGDAFNQSRMYDGASCMTRRAEVRLPVHPHPYAVPFTEVLSINFCFAAFHFGVTSIQGGRFPKQG